MRARRDNQKLGQATLADFHKVKVIFVGEDANNTSRRTSLLGGFTVVDIALEMWIILDHSRKSRSRSANRQRLWRFPNISDECSTSSRRHILERENRKGGQGVLTFFAKVKVTYTNYPVRAFRAV